LKSQISNAQTFRLNVSAEYVIVADHSFVYTLHREMTPLTQSVLQGAAQMRFSVNDNQTPREIPPSLT
jgi:hypothetical protein